MKSLLLSVFILGLGLSNFAYAETGGPVGGGDTGSAFVNGDTLYVTLLGDCNGMRGTLEVAPICNDDRLTRNYAEHCTASLRLMSTVMACADNTKRPQVLEISLSQSKVAREAKVLTLNLGNQQLDVRIKN